MVITIDGPAGSGKSTVAAGLAGRLDAAYLDTGAMYRAVTLAALESEQPMDDAVSLAEMAAQCKIAFTRQQNRNCVWLNGRDVTEAIRSRQVTAYCHKLADVPAVRELLVRQQRRIAQEIPILITEGRDQGTVVFPDAKFKFYLDATAECRAKRRRQQIQRANSEKHDQPDYEEILKAQKQRDQRDVARKVGALKKADNAIVIDTTEMTIDQVVNTLYERVRSTLAL